MKVFVDTSTFLAILDAGDRNHISAVRKWTEIVQRQDAAITSNYVIVETISLLQRRASVPVVRRFQTGVLPVVFTEWVDEEVHSAGISAALASRRRGPSLVDCVSFELMRRLDIRMAFAYDKHFADAGFEVV